MSDASSTSPRHGFSRRMRLSGAAQFAAVYDASVRTSTGPLLVYTRPNNLPHPRLGMAASRRVGTAVKRNAIKRRLREAFRLMQHDFPAGYDVVISVRAHLPLRPAEYQKLLHDAIEKLHRTWTRRQHNKPPSQ